ncbi:juvenile hormone esterase-like [Drosophila tropicalis]|uniref:juvenile hormone esterase-like n=1 Tax=Drosophila tropicalis TaxID=46794 RepID=UPI0035ABA09D
MILSAFGRRNRPRDKESLLVCPPCGCIKGTYMDGFQTQTFHAFLGIPYAKPPLGPLRFKSPQKKPKWNDNYDATKLKAVCLKKLVLPAPVIQGEEDCLYLNVYRPALYSPELLPVMVYIHGGGFFSGSYSPLTSGAEYFMDTQSVILVTISYRLGPLGFLSTADDNMLGNFGLKDQNLALKWVRENIFEFGGDSELITLFGHGFGGIASHLHLLSPMSRGLFHRVISMSGTANAPHAMTKYPLAQARKTAELCGIPNAHTISTAELTEALRNVDAETLINAEDGVKYWRGDPFSAYRPVVELHRRDAFLTEDPEIIMKDGHYPKIPWLLGTVPNEGAVRVANIIENATLFDAFNAQFDYILEDLLEWPSRFSREQKKQKTRQVVDRYLNGIHKLTRDRQGYFMDIITDRNFKHPLYKAVRTFTETNNPIENRYFMYNFNFRGLVSYFSVYSYANTSQNYGVVHGDDLIYLFRRHLAFPAFDRRSHEARLIESLVKYFINFAKFGYPADFPQLRYCTLQVLDEWPIEICDYHEFVDSVSDRNGFTVRKNSHYRKKGIYILDGTIRRVSLEVYKVYKHQS